MLDLKPTSEIVKQLLMTEPQTRDSDSFLYLKVLETICKENGVSLHRMTVPFFLMHMNDLGFPGFETVRRTRQYAQAKHPEFAATKRVAAKRKINEEVYRRYALGLEWEG